MTRFFIALTTLIISFVSSTYINADDFNFSAKNSDGVTIYYHRTKSTVEVVYDYMADYTGVVNIPSSVKHNSVTYPVIKISKGAFSGCSGLTSVTIPNSIITIEESAFRNCTALTTVNYYATNCAENCSSYYPVFENCPKFSTLKIGSNVQTIPAYLFKDCTGLKSVDIPNSVTSIGAGAFEGCTNLKSVTIPESVRTFGTNPFIGCTNLRYFYGDYASEDNRCLIKSENKIKTLISFAPFGCFSYSIPEDVNVIGACAFEDCNGMLSVSIPDGVTSIGRSAFSNCLRLTSINIPNSITTIEYRTFENCTLLSSITIPETVTSIGEKAFDGCRALTSLTIPSSIATIDKSAFRDCTGLTTVNFNATNCTQMGSENYPVFQNCGKLSSLIIGDNVQTIPAYAFYGCSGLASVAMSNSVKTIGSKAFQDCTSLQTINFGNSVTSIGYFAFSGCTSLVSVTFSNSVKTIGQSAFNNCTGLNSITIPESVTKIYDEAFNGCSNLTTVNFNAANCTQMGSSESPVFSGCTKLTTVNIGKNVQTIPGYAFSGCTSLTSVTIPEKVTSIGVSAFYGCSGLTTVYFNATNCTSMGSSGHPVFEDCPNSATLNIGDNVKSIPSYAFQNWSGLKKAIIGKSITTFGTSAFYGCTNLATIINYSPIPFIKGSTTYGYVAAYAKEIIQGVTTESITLNKTDIELPVGVTAKLTASILPENATDKSVIWKSLDPNIASVDAFGKVTAINGGVTTIEATCRSVTATCKVSVIVLPESVTFNKTSLTLTVGETETLVATVLPENTTDKTIVWTSSDTGVATVDDTGKVTAINGGTTQIVATCGSVSATCNLTVIVLAESVNLNKTTLTLKPGKTETLVATVLPENTTDKTVTWTSSDEDVATVDNAGKILAIKKGDVTISATCGKVSGICSVTVEYSETTDIIATPGSGLDDIFTNGMTIKDGESKKIDLTVVPATASPEFVWTTSDDSVVTIDEDGNITAVGVGTATVTVTSGSFTKTIIVTVDPILAESVTLNKTSLELKVGESETLIATVLPENTSDKKVTWKSSNSGIVAVDDAGKVTALKSGSAKITATCGMVSATCDITAVVVAESIILNKTSIELKIGESETLVATILPENTTDKTTSWSTTDENVATVDSSGLITAIAEGTATITATCGNVSASCNVTVTAIQAEAIILNKDALEMQIGNTFMLTATVLPPNTTDKTVTWESSDEAVVVVDNTGLVSAVGSGNAEVSAKCGTACATCRVAVNKLQQEIVWDQTFDGVKTGDVITLEATASSGLDVWYEIVEGSELASVVDNVLTVEAVGVVRIAAKQDGNDEYEAAEPVIKTIDIMSGIENIKADVNGRYIVWNMQGVKILDTENAKDIRYLPEGFYIINGTKVLLK